MKKIKNLSIANIKKIEGMVRREDLDFPDDGNKFKGFSYKGMPITTLRSDNVTYLRIRVDYLETEFTYKEWMRTEEYHLCGMFNGVSEFDLDVLVSNLEKVIAKVEEMNAKAKEEEVDITEVANKAACEIKMAEEVVENFKNNFKWYEAESYVLANLSSHLKSLEAKIKREKQKDYFSLSKYEKRIKNEKFAYCGYVVFAEDDYYIERLNEALK